MFFTRQVGDTSEGKKEGTDTGGLRRDSGQGRQHLEDRRSRCGQQDEDGQAYRLAGTEPRENTGGREP